MTLVFFHYTIIQSCSSKIILLSKYIRGGNCLNHSSLIDPAKTFCYTVVLLPGVSILQLYLLQSIGAVNNNYPKFVELLVL